MDINNNSLILPGFFGEILLGQEGGLSKAFFAKQKNGLVSFFSEGLKYQVQQGTLDRFRNDKIFVDDDNILLAIEGVILNSQELIIKYRKSGWAETVIEMYAQNGEDFFRELRGSFSGVLFDKKQDKQIIFTNHIGDKHLYYLKLADRIVFASSASELARYMRCRNMSCHLDVEAAYLILTFGFVFQAYTLCKEIRRLEPGHYIKIQQNKVEIVKYYSPSPQDNNSISMQDAIEGVDVHFRQAIKREYEKDVEYGYRHICGLSGGLDCRMTTWVSHEMGYADQLNITFSQTDYLDEKLAKAMARDLRHDWLFKSLDHGNFLIRLFEQVIDASFGGVMYYGLCHGLSMLELLDFSSMGLMHTGQLGDVVVSSYVKASEHHCASLEKFKAKMTSFKLIDRIGFLSLSNFCNLEQSIFCLRGLGGILYGNIPPQAKTEVASPFLDIDFLNYCMSIPLKYRANHKLYKKWILQKYPNAAKYVWETTKRRIDVSKSTQIWDRYNRLKYMPNKRLWQSFLHRTGLKKFGLANPYHMNPLGYWYDTNPALRKFTDEYFNQNIDLIANTELKNDCITLFTQGSMIEKNQVLTLLGATRSFMLK